MGSNDTPSTYKIQVSGTVFEVPSEFHAYLKSLPWTTNENGNGGVIANESNDDDKHMMTLHADPQAFRDVLYFVNHEKSLPSSFYKDENHVQAVGALAVVLGMNDLVCEIGKHLLPKDGFLKVSMKRSSSWQKRALTQSKRKIDSLVTSPTRNMLQKMKSPSYKQLVHSSKHVL